MCIRDRGEEKGAGVAGLRHERWSDEFAAGGVGVPRAISDRGRLVTAEGPAAGIDTAVLAGRGADPRSGAFVELGVACVDAGGVGGARASPGGRVEDGGDLCGAAGPQDGTSQRGVAAGGDEDDQRERGGGQRADAVSYTHL